jgi:hypothetical protein
MLEQPVAQLLQHTIAHDLGQIHLDDVQDPVDDRDRDQRRHQRVQRAEIWTTLNKQSLVEHLADQQRADHAQRRRRHDRDADQRQRTAMGTKQAHDSAAEPRRLGLRNRRNHGREPSPPPLRAEPQITAPHAAREKIRPRCRGVSRVVRRGPASLQPNRRTPR